MRQTSEEDWLLRQTEQMIRRVAEMLGLRSPEQTALALDEIAAARDTLLGPLAAVVPHVDVATAAHLVSDPRRIRALAELSRLESEARRALGDETGAASCATRGALLLAEAEAREAALGIRRRDADHPETG